MGPDEQEGLRRHHHRASIYRLTVNSGRHAEQPAADQHHPGQQRRPTGRIIGMTFDPASTDAATSSSGSPTAARPWRGPPTGRASSRGCTGAGLTDLPGLRHQLPPVRQGPHDQQPGVQERRVGGHLHHPGQHERHGGAGQRLGPAFRAPAGGGHPAGGTDGMPARCRSTSRPTKRRDRRPTSGRYNPFAANAPVTIYATACATPTTCCGTATGSCTPRPTVQPPAATPRPTPGTLPAACTPPHRRQRRLHRARRSRAITSNPISRGRLPLPDHPGRLLRPPQPVALRVGAERWQPDQRQRTPSRRPPTRSASSPTATGAAPPCSTWRALLAQRHDRMEGAERAQPDGQAADHPLQRGDDIIVLTIDPSTKGDLRLTDRASPVSAVSSTRWTSPTTRRTATSTSPNTPRRTRPAASTASAQLAVVRGYNRSCMKAAEAGHNVRYSAVAFMGVGAASRPRRRKPQRANRGSAVVVSR